MTSKRIGFVAVVAFITLVSSIGSVASADTLMLTDAAGMKYFVNNNVTFVTTSSASGAMSEASYTGPVAASTMGGGVTMSTLNDAFDGYGSIAVSLTSAMGPAQTGNPDYTFFNMNGMATLGCGGREAQFGTQTIGALHVTRRLFVPSDDTFARHLESFTNTGTTPITFTVIYANNLGSDSNTRITGSSSGDLLAQLTDTWVTTFQNYSGTTSSDPRLGHVLQGTGTLRAPLVANNFVDGDDNPYWTYSLTLAPAEKVLILTFVTGQPSKAASMAKAAELVTLPPHALECIAVDEIPLIANFHSTCGGTTADGTTCDDGNACTTGDVCMSHVCVGTPMVCTTGASDCTGVCNPATGTCAETNLPDGTACMDSDMCNGMDTCMAGACSMHSGTTSCDDHDDCTTDTCVAASGCMHVMMTTAACTPDASTFGQDGGTDAGEDASIVPVLTPDAGTDAAVIGVDAGTLPDAATTSGDDSGSAHGADSGTHTTTGGGSKKSGCSCRTVGSGSSTGAELAALLALAGVVMRSRRRRATRRVR